MVIFLIKGRKIFGYYALGYSILTTDHVINIVDCLPQSDLKVTFLIYCFYLEIVLWNCGERKSTLPTIIGALTLL